MGEVVPINDTVTDRNTTPGQALFSAIVNDFADKGVTLPRGSIAVAAKHGAAALADGVPPDAVLAGCIAALRAGKGRFALDYIAEMAVVKANLHLSDREYRNLIEGHKSAVDPAKQRQREMIERALNPEGAT